MHREELATARAGRSGREVVVGHQVDLIRTALARPGRVLEVGCGRGDVAVALGSAGYKVTAIDPALPEDVAPARNVRFERIAIEELTDPERYDAVAFTASLHHVEELGPALDRAAALLIPGGVLVVDDFDLRAPDDPTALWFFEIQELLAVAGLYDPARIDGKPSQPPIARWLAAHTHHATAGTNAVSGTIDRDRQLHDGASMIAAVRARFTDVVVAGGPYLYRYAAGGLRGPRAPWIAEAIHDAEKRRIRMKLMPAVGLTIVAKAR
jgi:2-polyprenyl-3-methyl-5-hydroxy-6-metoxy-1,4-benzoquinol methylase